MPPLTKEQLKDVRYVSLADFNSRIDQFESIDDKVKFATRYLLSHQTVENPDYSFDKAVQFARMKIGAASVDARYNFSIQHKPNNLRENPHIVDPYAENDLRNELFMGNPAEYLKGEAQKLANEIEEQDIESDYESVLKDRCKTMANMISSGFNTMVDKYGKSPEATVNGINARTQSLYGSKESYDKALSNIKGGFFSRTFGTSSTAAKNLNTVYAAFNNPKHALYGNTDALDKAGVEYIQHLFPGWERFNQLPSAEDLATLSGTQKDRAEFCVNMLKSLKAQKEDEEEINELIEACKNEKIAYEDLPQEPAIQNQSHKVVDLDASASEEKLDASESSIDQSQFQAQLKEDIQKDEEANYEEEIESDKDLSVDDLDRSYESNNL